MPHSPHHVYSADRASFLRSGLRKFLMNPVKLLSPLVREGMTILDMGCGPGFFTIAAAGIVGPRGKVIAADLQQAMLDLVSEAIKGDEISQRIVLHKCSEERIGVTEPVDCVLAIHVVHELPDRKGFFSEMKSIIGEGGTLFLMEPSFVVSKKEFGETLDIALRTGFCLAGRKRKILSRIAVFTS